MVKIANGVYQLTFGHPEELTPVTLRNSAAAIETLNRLSDKPSFLREKECAFRDSNRGCTITLPLVENEKIYGFGLQFKSFLQNGKKKIIRTNADPLFDSGDSHAPVPFYVSTLGYGVYVDTARYVSFYCGSSARKTQKESGGERAELGAKATVEELYETNQSSSVVVVDIPAAKGADIYVFTGDNMKDAVSRYNLFSGGGCLPPLKGLGVLYRGYFDADQSDLLAIAAEIRDDHIPCDIFGAEPGWQSKAYSCSYLWDEKKFPKPDEFIKRLKDEHYDVNLWEQAFVNRQAPFYEKIKEYAGDYLVWEGLVPDFTIRRARDVFTAHHEALVDGGIDGFKLDECDGSDYTGHWSFPDCAAFPSGLDGERMHNQLGIQFQSAQYELFKRKNKRTYSQVRASHALAASYPFVLYSDLYNHRDFFRAFVNSGFSGLLWSPEVRQTESAEELVRRIQTVSISAQAILNSWMIRNAPWRQFQYDKNLRNELLPEEERKALTAACKKALDLRMSLIPYLYSAFWKYKTTGSPVFRALVVDYPKDAYAQEIDDQILIGDSLLAAPMLADAGNSRRDIYLPGGVWYDFKTGEKFIGGQWFRGVEVPLDHIPIFVKGDSIIPLAEPVEWIEESTRFGLTVRIYGNGESSSALYEDDGCSFQFEKGEYSLTELIFNGKKLNREIGFCSPMNRYRIDRIHLAD